MLPAAIGIVVCARSRAIKRGSPCSTGSSNHMRLYGSHSFASRNACGNVAPLFASIISSIFGPHRFAQRAHAIRIDEDVRVGRLPENFVVLVRAGGDDHLEPRLPLR